MAAIATWVQIFSSCGGEGVCSRCKVIVKKGAFITEPIGRVTKEKREAGYVIA